MTNIWRLTLVFVLSAFLIIACWVSNDEDTAFTFKGSAI